MRAQSGVFVRTGAFSHVKPVVNLPAGFDHGMAKVFMAQRLTSAHLFFSLQYLFICLQFLMFWILLHCKSETLDYLAKIL